MQNQNIKQILKTLNKSIKDNNRALNIITRNLKKQEQIVKKEAQSIKQLQKINAAKKYKDATTDINKTMKSYRATMMYQTKKLNKMLKDIQQEQQIINISKESFIKVKLFVKAGEDAREYINQTYKYDTFGTKYYNLHLVDGTLRINNNLINDYQVRKFYCKEDDGKDFVNDFISIIKDNDEDAQNRINQYEQSQTIYGFEIIYKQNVPNPNNVNIMNMNLMNDNNNKKMNSYYTKYQVNLQAQHFKDLLVLEHNDYIKANYRPYSCLLTAIINKFYNRFNRVKSDGKRRNTELTYDYLCRILEIENKSSHNAVSLQLVVDKFFTRFNFLSLYVYDPYMKLLFKYEAEDKKNNSSLRIIVKDKHVYELNDNLKHLEQIVNLDDDERNTIKISDKYNISDKPVDIKEVFCNDMDEIFQTIKSNVVIEELKQLKIITSVDMQIILLKVIDTGYTPKVFFSSFLYKITMFVDSLNISIETCDNNAMYGQQVIFENLEEYKAYNTAYDQMYKSVIKKEFISDYHSSVIEIEDEYTIRPIFGYLGEKQQTNMFNTLDENKAYTECLQSITRIPIFNYFDVYMPYDNHTIEDLTYYIVDVLEDTIESQILFGQKYTRTYGYILKSTSIKYKILFYRRPLKTEEVDYKTSVETLYSNKSVCVNMKKMIVNKITGMLEMKKNKAHLTKIFEDYDEANYYSIKYSGKVMPILTNSCEEMEMYNDLDEQFTTTILTKSETNCYIVNVHEEKRLVNGLSAIKDMIYLNQRQKMCNLHKKMTELGLKVVGCKTDCLYYIGSDMIVKKNFKLTKTIGDYKIEESKYIPEKKITLEVNELIKFEDYSKVQLKTFTDEKNTVEINKYIASNNKLLIKGEYPGVGKSTMCKKFDDNSLFILPYNRLCQNLKTEGYDAITYSKAFGLFKDDVEMNNIKRFDMSEYDTIVFDEALLYTPDRLKRLDKMMQMYPDKTFLSTGDTDQRNPIGFDNEKYLAHCMNVIFRNQVLLKDIKRLVNVEDIQKWKDLKKDIFNSKMSVQEICKKHKLNTVNSLKDVKTTKNICYFNFRCDVVNNHVHENILKKTIKYYEGLEVICRKYEKTKGFTLNTNYIYKIKSIGKDVIITDEIDEVDYRIPKTMLSTHFKLPYSMTVDSVQGMSFDVNDKITIFDSNLPYTDSKFLWTAITRSRSLDNVQIFIHSDTEVERFTESKIKQYFKFKCAGYVAQDTKANRKWETKDYIDADWINTEIKVYGTTCKFCNKNMTIYVNENGNVESNLTVDRADNSKAHIKSNCSICCLNCNISKH